MTLANKITLFRIALTLVYFVVLSFALGLEKLSDEFQWTLDACIFLFLLATALDVVDGWVARMYNEQSELGRILDPLADKIIICGSFVYFVLLEPVRHIIHPWMAVLIITREFVVHAVRLDAEGRGIPFPATFWGKAKTFVQNFAAGGCLIYSAHLCRLPEGGRRVFETILIALVYLAMLSTLLSGIIYAVDAARVLTRERGKVQ
jgi:CDP-diacylglycerol--glycerol-3-phosphate 3-phosphatidyltransferase